MVALVAPRAHNLLEFNFRECETYLLMRSICSFYTLFPCLEIHALKYERTIYIILSHTVESARIFQQFRAKVRRCIESLRPSRCIVRPTIHKTYGLLALPSTT